MIRRYVRVPDGNHREDGSLSRGRPVGLVLGENRNGIIHLGYSRCSDADQYNPQSADQIALSRLQSSEFWYDSNNDTYSGDLTRDLYSSFSDMIEEIEWVITETLDHPERNCRMPKYSSAN